MRRGRFRHKTVREGPRGGAYYVTPKGKRYVRRSSVRWNTKHRVKTRSKHKRGRHHEPTK